MPTTLSIDNLEDDIVCKLEAEAARQGIDVASVVRNLLEASVGRAAETHATSPRRTLRDLAGTWSEDEFQAFQEATRDFERVDRELWR